jgi:acetate kinase
MKVLVINAGSSSLKYQLFDMDNEYVIAKGNCQKIGIPGSFIEHKYANQVVNIEQNLVDHIQAIQKVLYLLTCEQYGVLKDLKEISAIGHRVLHGGEIYKDSVIITPAVMRNLEVLKPLGPLHMPANIAGIEACKEALPHVPQVAVFDTAFHANMPKEAFLYAIPYEAYTDWRIRRYGFHGTSHKFVANEVSRILDKKLKDLKIITVHLGNGSSITAVKGGKSIDTSMGFTPLEGVIMGTRSGDVDASVVSFISKKLDIKGDEISDYFNKKCGALGISGVSSDMRDINKAANEGNERAKLVVPMMAYRIKKYIGSYVAAMNGVDAIVFTGGIGENQEDLREEVMKDMEYLGIDFDVEKNLKLPRGTIEELSKPNSKVKVYRIPTNEELVIARDTINLIS